METYTVTSVLQIVEELQDLKNDPDPNSPGCLQEMEYHLEALACRVCDKHFGGFAEPRQRDVEAVLATYNITDLDYTDVLRGWHINRLCSLAAFEVVQELPTTYRPSDAEIRGRIRDLVIEHYKELSALQDAPDECRAQVLRGFLKELETLEQKPLIVINVWEACFQYSIRPFATVPKGQMN